MAFPTVPATNTSTSSATSSHTVNLPASIAAGDLLILIFWSGNSGVHTVNTPSGWTSLGSTADGSSNRLTIFYKVASGSEGSTETVTTSNSQDGRHVTYRIGTGTYQGTPEVGTAANGSSTTPNPPSLTTSWGAADTLWLAIAGGNTNTITSPPTNYGSAVNSTSGFFVLGTDRRQLNAASEDPGTFTFGSCTWVAQTLAIRPVSGSAYNLPVGAGSYSYTGQAAALYHGLKVIAAVGSYVLTGQTVSLKRTARQPVGAGSYAMGGQVVNLLKTWRVPVGAGAYTFTGQDVAVLRGKALLADVGSFDLLGQDVQFFRTYNVIASVGVYSLQGQLVDVIRMARLVPLPGVFTLGGKAVELTWGQSPFWQPENEASGAWASESGVSGSWSSESPVVGDWTEEDEGQ